ncbi:DUF742 domain-containing protein [Allostreptomyces psammosilenae]|uniref:DUF742 domain-containing protein n=1 Tax=Allostreptomyces psammosilenae TaxID=1892865 RepID=A0A853A3Z3_9ACTN|nr:DUF742 domain-containing protein [Allostreptomyces psammosilenae]NYI08190.1 hypothetical protein [Allostreptomyces psammosilenae]
MAPDTPRWFDDAAGRVVRPYAMTGGRTRPTAEVFDLISMVVTEEDVQVDDTEEGLELGPEHQTILDLCHRAPQSVADIASDLDLPVGVVRVLLSDLLDGRMIRVTRPVPPAQLPDERILREVIHGLRAL